MRLMWRASPFEILLVEDNPGDVELMQEAFGDWSSATRVSIVDDGEKASDFLQRRSPYENSPVPELIILDLNLPRKCGFDLLRELKGDPRLTLIPVIVLTTSDREKDVRNAYSLHANCYLTKPLEADDLIAKVKAIEQFWLVHARLPQALA